jgi:SAM-dependent methyltransferase
MLVQGATRMDRASPYAAPRTVTDLADCYFYHTTEVPGHGLVEGEWDLRAGVDAYLGGADFRGRRVLEIGTASGFLCFAMERRGADVVAFDLSPEHAPDLIPLPNVDPARRLQAHREHVRKLINGFWLCHRAFASRARAVYGSVYAIPEEIGPVDVATFGCVLLHLRDPLLALMQALRLTRQTAIITEPVVVRSRLKRALLRRLGPALLLFPRPGRANAETTWWVLMPELVQALLGLFGFEESKVTYHTQIYRGKSVKLFTVVGQRTRPFQGAAAPAG